jgi:hypothetical protein
MMQFGVGRAPPDARQRATVSNGKSDLEHKKKARPKKVKPEMVTANGGEDPKKRQALVHRQELRFV